MDITGSRCFYGGVGHKMDSGWQVIGL